MGKKYNDTSLAPIHQTHSQESSSK